MIISHHYPRLPPPSHSISLIKFFTDFNEFMAIASFIQVIHFFRVALAPLGDDFAVVVFDDEDAAEGFVDGPGFSATTFVGDAAATVRVFVDFSVVIEVDG